MMTTYSEFEDLHDWIISHAGEFESRISELNGEKPAHLLNSVKAAADQTCRYAIETANAIDALLAWFKAQDEYPPL